MQPLLEGLFLELLVLLFRKYFLITFLFQGSTWVLQATHMNGRLGRLTIRPDQMEIFNSILIVTLVPVFAFIVYPLTNLCFTVTPLKKMSVGGFIAALAFVVAGILQIFINNTQAIPIPEGHVQINFYTSTMPDLLCKYQQRDDNVYYFKSDEIKNCNLGFTFHPNQAYVATGSGKNTSKLIVLFFLNKITFSDYFTFENVKVNDGNMRMYVALDGIVDYGETIYVTGEYGAEIDSTRVENGNQLTVILPFYGGDQYHLVYGPGCNININGTCNVV